MNETTKLDARYDIGVDDLAKRHRKYLEAVKPLVDVKVAMYSLATPTTIFYKDGTIEHRYDFTPKQKETLRLANEAIEWERLRIFGA